VFEVSSKKIFTEKICHADIAIGNDKVSTEFQSHLKFRLWNEDDITLEMTGVKGVPSLSDNKVVLNTSSGKMKWYRDGDSFKWITVFNSKPATNKIIYKLGGNWQDFLFHYQTPFPNPTYHIIDGEEWVYQWQLPNDPAFDNRRRRKIDGGYWVRHKTKQCNQYMLGTAFDIYVPKATDATGKSEWCTIEVKDGYYTETIPQIFLDEAVYPVTVNATFGETDESGFTGTTFNVNWIIAGHATPASSGTVTSLHFYSDAADNVTGGLYETGKPSDLEPNGSTPEFTTASSAQWNQVNYSTGPDVVGSTEYKIGFHFSATTRWFRKAGSADSSWDDDETYEAGVAPSSVNWDAVNYDWLLAAYATYTPTGGNPD
jgi:hypothetical protein